MAQFNLECWSCHKRVGVEGPLPQFAFELANAADAVGWKGFIDMNHRRSLVFCSDACADAQRTKSGAFRARPKRECGS